MSNLYIVTGAGPVGTTIAEQLAGQGHRVRILTRSGSGPDHPLVERRSVDVSRPEALDELFAGAAAIFHCIHGSAYSAAAWEAELPAAEQNVLAAAGRAGAVVVFPESLYSYDRPDQVMTEDGPRRADGGKRGVRTALLAGRASSATPTVSVVASDFFGPHVLNAHAGERMVPLVLSGKTIRVLGNPDLPHSFTYVPDLAAAMIAAAGNREPGIRCCPPPPFRPSRSAASSRPMPGPPGLLLRRSGPSRAGCCAAWVRSPPGCANWRRCPTSSSARS